MVKINSQPGLHPMKLHPMGLCTLWGYTRQGYTKALILHQAAPDEATPNGPALYGIHSRGLHKGIHMQPSPPSDYKYPLGL